MSNAVVFAIAAIFLIAILFCTIWIFREYERGVVFTLGRFWKVKGPGLVTIIPLIQKVVRVDLRTVVLEVPTQDAISRDKMQLKFAIDDIDPDHSMVHIASLPSPATVSSFIFASMLFAPTGVSLIATAFKRGPA